MFSARKFVFLIGTAVLCLPQVALAAGGGGGGGGASMPSESAPQYDPAVEYRNGVEALQANRFADASRSFTRVLSVMPKAANVHYLLGSAKAGSGDWKAAAKAYAKAVRYDDKMIVAHRDLGVAQAKSGDLEKAKATLASLTARDTACAGTCPETADLKAAVAAVTAAIGVPTAAVDSRPSLLFADTKGGDGAYLTAVALINERRFDAAIESLKKAEAAFGAHPDVLTYLGFANRKLGRFDVAEAYYRDALALAPNHRGATEYYGELKVERGDLAGARAMLAKLDQMCGFGCAEADELRRWVDQASSSS